MFKKAVEFTKNGKPLALVGLYPDGYIEVCHVPEEGKDVEDAECRSTKRPEGEKLYYLIQYWYSAMGGMMRGLQTTEEAE